LISTNLGEIVKRVVPEKEGVLNLRAAKQVSFVLQREADELDIRKLED
jgi:hypothetical protein